MTLDITAGNLSNLHANTLLRARRLEAAFTHVVLEAYGPVQLSKAMRAKRTELAAIDDERSQFLEQFDVTTDDSHHLTVAQRKKIAAKEIPGVNSNS